MNGDALLLQWMIKYKTTNSEWERHIWKATRVIVCLFFYFKLTLQLSYYALFWRVNESTTCSSIRNKVKKKNNYLILKMSVFFWESILHTFFLKSKCGELINVGLFSYTKTHNCIISHLHCHCHWVKFYPLINDKNG